MTREEWLTLAAAALRGRFPRALPEESPAVSVGHPARATRRVRLYDVAQDVEGQAQVYVSPYLSDPCEVLAVLAYALCEVDAVSKRHAAGVRRTLGFAPGAAVIPTGSLALDLEQLARDLPPYPHVYTDPAAMASRTQATRMLKAECTGHSMLDAHDPYIVRLTRTQADRGMPRCGVCDARMVLA